jgi:hypothetical protein
MAKTRKRPPHDQASFAALSLYHAIVETAQEADPSFAERLIRRLERNRQVAIGQGQMFVAAIFHLFLQALRERKNLPPQSI